MTRHAGWFLTASLTLHVLAVIVFPPMPLDLRVYREASPLVLSGGLYDYQLHTSPPIPVLPFTYPPFAALVFLPLSWIPWTAAIALWQAASVGALAVMCACADRLLFTGRDRNGRSRVMLWTAGGLWLEPVRHTLDQGQVNLLLGALVLGALALLRTAAGRGTVLGLAAAVKLTPAFGGLYLLATRQWRAAAWALAAAVGATALAWQVAPHESVRYWFTLVTDTQRIGPLWSVRNQSLRGALSRLLGPDADTAVAWWTALALVTVLPGRALWNAVRRQDLLGILITAELYGLLVTPISWSHHWVWCLPTMIWLAHGPARRRLLSRVALVAWAITTVGRVVPLLIRAEDGLPHPSPYPALLAWPGAAYAVCAVLSFLAIGAGPEAADAGPARPTRVDEAWGARDQGR
ncbi:glycosyltransferase 87 family protein [Streptomyces sp. NPDC001795]|uniref:glycosyltransferase 87 family protein n=1 Tax=Streptomyces sp. NPDC001795 TaxID=3154525 RepID=UPI003317387B